MDGLEPKWHNWDTYDPMIENLTWEDWLSERTKHIGVRKPLLRHRPRVRPKPKPLPTNPQGLSKPPNQRG